MREFKKRRSRGSELLRVGLSVAGILALGFVAFTASRGAWGMYGKFAEAAAARSSAEIELMELRSRHAKVEADVESFATDRGLEQQVRERYGVARPGEGQIDIVRSSSSTDALVEGRGFWDKMWDLLFVW